LEIGPKALEYLRLVGMLGNMSGLHYSVNIGKEKAQGADPDLLEIEDGNTITVEAKEVD